MSESGVYLYGIAKDLESVPSDAAVGVSGAPVRAVRHGGLAAIVSTVGLAEYGEEALRRNLERLEWLEETARAHHAVVAEVALIAPTAPVRLATVFHDDERVRELLEERRDDMSKELSRVARRAEWGVKAYGDPQAGEPTASEVAGPVAGAKSGLAYLQRRTSQRRRLADSGQRMADRAEDIYGELEGYAVAVRRHAPQDPRLSRHEGVMVLNAAYLVDHARSDAFASAAERLSGRMESMRIEVTGPWPPYSFISLEAEG